MPQTTRKQRQQIVDLIKQGKIKAVKDKLSSWNITHLDLSESDLSSEDGISIAKILSENQTLGTLNLSDNKLCVKGGIAILNALKNNSSLLYPK